MGGGVFSTWGGHPPRKQKMGNDIKNMKAAIFDMDGTLVDTLVLWNVMWEGFGKKYMGIDGFRPDAAFDREMRTLVLVDAMACIHEKFGIGRDKDELHRDAQAWCIDYYENRVQMKPGAREFLDDLQARGIPMVLASATDPVLIRAGLRHCDMEKYFTAVLSCADIGKGKEQPDIFLAALDKLGTQVADTWMFEDSVTALQTARRIGMPTVGIYDQYNYGHDELERLADIYIGPGHSLAELI